MIDFSEEFSSFFYENDLGLPNSIIWFGVWDERDWGGDNPEFYFTTEAYFSAHRNIPDSRLAEYLYSHGLPRDFNEIGDNQFEVNSTKENAILILETLGFIHVEVYDDKGWVRAALKEQYAGDSQ